MRKLRQLFTKAGARLHQQAAIQTSAPSAHQQPQPATPPAPVVSGTGAKAVAAQVGAQRERQQSDARAQGDQPMAEHMEGGVPSEEATAAAVAGGGGQGADSCVIAIADHCPPPLMMEEWTLDAFAVMARQYHGHISSVYRAIHRQSGITVALKLYHRSRLNDMERHQIAREIWLHIQLDHPSIIALYAAWKDRDHIVLALEWAPEGTVYTFAQANGGRLPESLMVPVILQPTMSALNYIHSLGMIHRDVKPENILLTRDLRVKLADFGLSIHESYEVANTRLGTIDYLSPEILDCPVKAHPEDHKAGGGAVYSNKVDCWSVGVLVYELLLGCTPFEARTPQETLMRIQTQEAALPPAGLSSGAASFLRAALVRRPEQRAGMADLLSHPWVATLCAQRSVAPSRPLRGQADVLMGVASAPGGGSDGERRDGGGGVAAKQRLQSCGCGGAGCGSACCRAAAGGGGGARGSCPHMPLQAQLSAPVTFGQDAAALVATQQGGGDGGRKQQGDDQAERHRMDALQRGAGRIDTAMDE